MEWMLLPLKRYATFTGRSQRKEFWLWVLAVIIVTLILSVIDSALGLGGSTRTTASAVPGQFNYGARSSGGILTAIFSLAILIPNLAVQVRRLHDTDRSGWWILLPVLPYVIGFALMIGGFASSLGSGQPVPSAGSGMVGLMAVGGIFLVIGLICAVLLLVWFCMDGTRGANRFGDDPKQQNLGEVFS